MLSVGGNLHNEFLSYSAIVHVYNGAIGIKGELCHNGDYVMYVGENEVSLNCAYL